jgi:ferredoxin-thioredoxin reductase catalytic subunit
MGLEEEKVRLYQLMEEYAKRNGYSLILDSKLLNS